MNLLPAFAPTSNSNVADLFSKPLHTTTHQRIVSLIGAGTTVDPLASADPTATVASSATVDSSSAVFASVPTTTSVSNSVPTLPIVLDTGASFSISTSKSDFLPVAQAPYGLFRSPISVVSKTLASQALASTLVDPHTLITGEDIASASNLSSPDTTAVDSDSGPSFTKATLTLDSLELPLWPSSIPSPLWNCSTSLWNQLRSIGFIGSLFQGWLLLSPTSTSVAATISKSLLCSICFQFGSTTCSTLVWNNTLDSSVEYFGFQLLPNLNTKVDALIYWYSQLLRARHTTWILHARRFYRYTQLLHTASTVQVLAWVTTGACLIRLQSCEIVVCFYTTILYGSFILQFYTTILKTVG